MRRNGETAIGGRYAKRRMVLTPSTEQSATRMSLMALMEHIHSDVAIQAGVNFCSLMIQPAHQMCRRPPSQVAHRSPLLPSWMLYSTARFVHPLMDDVQSNPCDGYPAHIMRRSIRLHTKQSEVILFLSVGRSAVYPRLQMNI